MSLFYIGAYNIVSRCACKLSKWICVPVRITLVSFHSRPVSLSSDHLSCVSRSAWWFRQTGAVEISSNIQTEQSMRCKIMALLLFVIMDSNANPMTFNYCIILSMIIT